jgi:ABC-2 type transport system permease protein
MILIAFIWGIFKEALAKKIILAIIIFFSLIIFLILYFINLESVEGVQTILNMYGQGKFEDALLDFELAMISGIPRFMLMTLFVVLVSSFIPSMLKEGNLDLLLSKPISRTKIIIGHFLAGILFVLISLTLIIGIIWFIISAKTNIWHFKFLFSIFWLTFVFSIIYSTVILFASITKSTVFTILINVMLYFPVTWGLYMLNNLLRDKSQVFGGTGEFIVKFFYFLLPKPWDVQEIGDNLIKGTSVMSYMPLITTILFMIIVISLSILYFKKKDY